MRVSLLYLGCRVNQAEITEMEAELLTRGHEIVGLEESPDACIVNTCTVTKKSDDQSRQMIRRAAGTGANVIVTGCYAELNQAEAENIAGVGSVVLNSNKHYIINKFIDNNSSTSSTKAQNLKTRSKYFLKVQDGCDNRCSYCNVWKARGRSRSILFEDAVRMAQRAEADGYMEIDLTGIHLGMYGKDLSGKGPGSVGGLLEALLKSTQVCRFRLSSLEINEVDEKIAELLGDSRVCRHLHVPLQSGDDSVLRDMNRSYTSEQYARKIQWLHKKTGSMGLGADIIAGFPTESNSAFEATLSLVRSLPFTYLHVFPYSIRHDTLAADMHDTVGQKERKNRAAVLRSIGEDKRADYLRSNIGMTLEVLLESCDEDGEWTGTTGNYLKVKRLLAPKKEASSGRLKGSLVNIKALATEGKFITGNAIESP